MVSWWREPVYRFCIAFGNALFRLLRLRISVTGEEHVPTEGAGIIVITHFGYLDFALTESIIWKRTRRLMRFMATAASFRHPVAGPLMRSMRHIPVERAAGAGAYTHALAALSAGELLGIFPEASVSTDGRVKSLKTGAVRLAQESGAPIVPVAVWGGHRVITKGHPFSLRQSWKVPVVVLIGEPFTMEPGRNAVTETRRLREVLSDLVASAQSDYPSTVIRNPIEETSR